MTAITLPGFETEQRGATRRAASISPCGQYRWWLTRTWDERLPRICWIGLNPSTADGLADDPTIRRMIAFSRSWGAGGLVVVNLFAWRATDPKNLPPTIPDDAHRINLDTITYWARGGKVVAAWGADARATEGQKPILKVLRQLGLAVDCLGTTKDGYPRHPLYLAGNTPLRPFREAGQ